MALIQTLQKKISKMNVTFEYGEDILCLETCKRRQKLFNLEKNQIFFFPTCPSFVFALISPNLQIILQKKITYPSRSQRVELVLRISKKLDVNSRNETLTKTQKTPSILNRLTKVRRKIVKQIYKGHLLIA